jgi:hypothetical protein
MAYQLTNATSVEDLIDKIVDFAQTNGWTVDRNGLVGSLRTATVHKSGNYINLFNDDTIGVRVRGAVGYDSGAAGGAQPNQGVSECYCNCGSGPFSNVFLFAGTEYVFTVVEIASGIFRHIAFGELVKFGTFTGGTFYDATRADTSVEANSAFSSRSHRLFDNGWGNSTGLGGGGVRCDFDGETNYFAPFRSRGDYATPTASGGMGGTTGSNVEASERVTKFYVHSVNEWTGVTPLQPVMIRVERDAGFWTSIGEVPGIRFLNMDRYAPGDEFTIGSDTWKVFPWVRKGTSGSGTEQYSQNYALAYLK